MCATDGNSYNNPCLVREASCMKQEQIDVKHLGRCAGETLGLPAVAPPAAGPLQTLLLVLHS